MKLTVTVIQSDLVWENVKANLDNFTKIILSDDKETDLIILPEMFAYGFSMNPEKFAPYRDEITGKMLEFAKHKSAVVTGSVITGENGTYFNTLVWMQPDGTYKTYNKRHLFSFAGEDKHYTKGKTSLITELKGWKIKPLICYDLRFPVWSRNKNDYDLLLYVANWPERRADAWKTLLKARAIENLSYVIGVNRVGYDGNDVYHSGDSAVFDAKGNRIDNIPSGKKHIETITLNLDELKKFRKKFPAAKDADDFTINY
ncbi:MAG: amidohydrolase [Chlorobi bacterium]|nr:amidohydrolase [Chlorobiota bacterium]